MEKKAGADTAKFKMKPLAGSQPGLEFDGHGNIIPLDKRTQEDQHKAVAAGERPGSVKNPEQEAEHPAPMPRNQQGQGGNTPGAGQGGTKRATIS